LEPVLEAADPVVEPIADATKPAVEPVLRAVKPAVEPAAQVLEPVTNLVTGSSDDDEPAAGSHSAAKPSADKQRGGDEPAMASLSSGPKKTVSNTVGRTAAGVLDTLHAA
jgi:hypothetical protein